MRKIASVFLIAILLTVSANGTGSGHIYSATRQSNSVDVRLIAPENALLVLGVYDSYTHQMKDVLVRETGIVSTTRTLTVSFNRTPLSTEYVNAFLLDKETSAPLCVGVLADVVIPSNPEPVVNQYNYVLNTNSKIFHNPTCASANRISTRNREDYYGTRAAVIAMGYTPCRTCRP